jgi:uncharacterized protein (TIGR02246 family)
MARVKDELAKLERQYWQAVKDKNIEAMAQLTDERCTVAGAQGAQSMDRAHLKQMMKSATWSLREFDLTDIEVRPITDDVAVVSYQVREDAEVDGKPAALEAADTSVWVRRDGRWLCALHTESIAGDPFGRDRRPH